MVASDKSHDYLLAKEDMAMSQETIDFSFLAKLGQKTFDELKLLRREVAEIRTLSLQSIIEGALAKIEDKVDNALERIAAIEQNP